MLTGDYEKLVQKVCCSKDLQRIVNTSHFDISILERDTNWSFLIRGYSSKYKKLSGPASYEVNF